MARDVTRRRYHPLMKKEHWVHVPDWPYDVSSFGRIRSRPRMWVSDTYRKYHINRYRIVQPSEHPNCGLIIKFKRNNKVKQRSLKRVVADAFIPPAGIGKVILKNPKDPFNYSVDNIRRIMPDGTKVSIYKPWRPNEVRDSECKNEVDPGD